MSAQNANVSHHTLNNGRKISAFGMGTFLCQDAETIVKTGIDIGYRLVDTAALYKNDEAIGRALKAVFQEKKVTRDEVFIVSKSSGRIAVNKEVIRRSTTRLFRLVLDSLAVRDEGKDEYDVLNSSSDDSVSFEETWPAMEELVQLGLTKSIGLSNFNSQQIETILKIATIKPVVNQVECNLYFSQEKLREFCKQRDILIMAYCPLYAHGNSYSENHGLYILEEPIIKDLAQKHKKTVGAIIFKYLIQCGVIPILRTDKPDRLKSNFDIWHFALVAEDFDKMRSLNKNQRCISFKKTVTSKNYPFAIEF